MTAPARRLFFALWPDPGPQRSLAEAAADMVSTARARQVPPENLHVTLAFLGSVPETRLHDVTAVGRAVTAKVPFSIVDVSFDALEHWKKPRVICATLSDPSYARCSALEVLAASLKSQLLTAGLMPAVDAGSTPEFRPHVTLARKAAQSVPPRGLTPVVWRFTDFVLVESTSGPRSSVYTILEPFELKDP